MHVFGPDIRSVSDQLRPCVGQEMVDVFDGDELLGQIGPDVCDWVELRYECRHLGIELNGFGGIKYQDRHIARNDQLPVFQLGDRIQLCKWQHIIPININYREATQLLSTFDQIKDAHITQDQPLRFGCTPEGLPIGGNTTVSISNPLEIKLGIATVARICGSFDGKDLNQTYNQFKLFFTDTQLILYLN